VDNPHMRPRFAQYHGVPKASAEANVQNAMVAMHLPQTIPQVFGSTPQVAEIPDFNIRAKTYKRARLNHKIFKLSLILGIIICVVIAILGIVGLILNSKYAGRALPYTYVGELSVGGLTEAQISSVLDNRAKEVSVILKDGGLTREVPASALGVTFDTKAASQKAISGFNPFRYLDRRSLSVPTQVSDLAVDGYIRMSVADMQTKNVNASMVKDKNGISISPEINGFRTSSAYVADQLRKQLPQLDNAVINLSKATDRPSITAADLQDDVELAKRIIATNVVIEAAGQRIVPTQDQKFGWLQMDDSAGSNTHLSQAKIKEYVYSLVSKSNTEPVNEKIVTNPDGSQKIEPGENGRSVNNSEDVIAQIIRSLEAQQPVKVAFTFDEKQRVTINRNGLVLASATPTTPAGDNLSQETVLQPNQNTALSTPAQ